MYDVDGDDAVGQQIEALPATMLAAFAELRTALEVAPWAGDSINVDRPDEPVRTLTFGPGGAGLVVYLVLEDQRRAELLQVTYVG